MKCPYCNNSIAHVTSWQCECSECEGCPRLFDWESEVPNKFSYYVNFMILINTNIYQVFFNPNTGKTAIECRTLKKQGFTSFELYSKDIITPSNVRAFIERLVKLKAFI